MEESTQRRERLKAMRMEASQADAINNDDNRSAVSLANPLLESTTNPEIQTPAVSQSFNYYTKPMAAYSGSQPSPHINQSPNPQTQRSPGYYASSNYAYSYNPPQSSNLPNPSWRGNSPNPRGYYGPRGVGFPSPQTHFTSGSGKTGYPSPSPNPGRGSGRGYPSLGPNHGSGLGYPSPHFTNSPSHGSNHGSGFNQGRGYGRARGGRGDNRVSGEDRPDRFFSKSMVEDPWKFLEPIVWKSLKKRWLPHSDNAKKPRVSESSRQTSSQPSLAEILAASFNEVADDEPNVE